MVFSKGLQNKNLSIISYQYASVIFVNINLMHVLDNFGLFYQ
ncbi:hypothetical protein AO366_1165 [Moraxella catarrhalis]|nr:hypothetical protein AO369_0467 [Moraxella catarrhalis]OAV32755.1 hypothetical protein AO366_1165 [Moraxella catarrhalis]